MVAVNQLHTWIPVGWCGPEASSQRHLDIAPHLKLFERSTVASYTSLQCALRTGQNKRKSLVLYTSHVQPALNGSWLLLVSSRAPPSLQRFARDAGQ